MSTPVSAAPSPPPPPSEPTSASPPGHPRSTAVPRLIWRNTVLLALAQAFVGMGNQMTPTLAPIIVVQLLGSPALAGIGTSLLSVSRLLVAYPVGYLTDRFGRKAGLMLGLVVSLVGTILMGVSILQASFAMYVASLLVFGCGVGAAQQLRLAAADMFLPARRGEGLGYVLTGSLVGALGAPLLIAFGESVAQAFGQDPLAVVWLLVPAILLPSMVLVLLVRPDPKTIAQHLERYYPGYVRPKATAGTRSQAAGFREWLRHYPLAAAFAVSFATQGVMTMMMAMTSLALSHHGHALPFISLSVSIHVVGMFGFSIPLGRLTDRLGRRTVMLIGTGISALGSILVPTSPDYVVITLGTFLVGLGWSCVNVASSALIADVVGPRERGRAIGTSDTFSQAASIVMPLAGGPLVVLVGLPALSVVALAVLVVPVVMLARLREPSPGRYAHEAVARA